jgi:hypothetical protein
LKHDYLVVHNGVISNDSELKKKHEELGFVYQTAYEEGKELKFNDSEALAIEVARYIEGQSDEVDTYSNAAFIALQIDKKTDKVIQVFFGRSTSSDLNIHSSAKRIEISSEGRGGLVETGKLWSFPIDTLKLESRVLAFKSFTYVETPRKKFMTVKQQEEAIRQAEEVRVSGFAEDDAEEPVSVVSKNNEHWMCDLNTDDEWELNNELEAKVLELEDEATEAIDDFKQALKDHEKVFKTDPVNIAGLVFAALVKMKQECEKVAEEGYTKLAKGEKLTAEDEGEEPTYNGRPYAHIDY